MVKCTGKGLVVERPGVLSKVQMLTLVLEVGVFKKTPIADLVLRHPDINFLVLKEGKRRFQP